MANSETIDPLSLIRSRKKGNRKFPDYKTQLGDKNHSPSCLLAVSPIISVKDQQVIMEFEKKIKSSAFHLHRLPYDNIQAVLKKLNFKAASRTMQTNSEITKLMEKIQKIDAHLKQILDIDQERNEIIMMTVGWRSKILDLVVDKHSMKNFPDEIYAELMKEYLLYSKEADACLVECTIAQKIAMFKIYASSWCCRPS